MPLRILVSIAALLSLMAGGNALAQDQPQPEGAASADLTGTAALPLTGKRRAAFEAYIADALYRFDVPGAAVAVVQNGNVVYLKGFGVKQVDGTDPVTPDTLMMIGSITKSMTTMMAGSLVDDGQLDWGTRLVDLLPAFAVGDRTLTDRLTIRDAFCNCSGVPGLNLESYFATAPQTPDDVVTALADVQPIAGFGEQFIYNNVLIGSGGYALGAAENGTSSLGLAYDTGLRERVLGPIGMRRTTFDSETVIADGDYALPHATDLSGNLRPLPLMAERVLLPFRPAGALWSSAREMARYLETELARGVAPDGTRVISADNLEATWAPGVSVPNYYGGPPQMAALMTRYGLGWTIGEYRGLRVVSHTGGTGGFTSEIAFLPDAGLGIVVLSNALSFAPVPLAFQFAVEVRLFELLFDQPPEFDAQLMAQAKAGSADGSRPALGTVDAAQVEPLLGRYENADLGAVSLALRNDRLVLDTGALSTELRPRSDGDPEAAQYLLHDPPLSLFSEIYDVTIGFSGENARPQLVITVPASVTGPETRYVFERG